MLQKISRRWRDICVVAAPGPSLTNEMAEACKGVPAVAVNDAWCVFRSAEILYAADVAWWEHHEGCAYFTGEKWSSHSLPTDDKIALAEQYGLNLIRGAVGDGFSFDPVRVHYGLNSGFQAINLAIHFMGWQGKIVLVGFDMRCIDGKRHFFGEHPAHMHRETDYSRWFPEFIRASKFLPPGLEIVNCTPGSALPCFRRSTLDAEL